MIALRESFHGACAAFFPCVSLQPGVEVIEQTTNMDAMKDTTGPIHSLERLRAYALAALVPFFVDGAAGCETAARLAAEALLDEYQAATPRELQLSAQIIASNLATLACLGAASAQNLSVRETLRLRNDALALHRKSEKATKALQARRKQRATDPKAMTLAHTRWDEGGFQLTINQALDKLTDANAKIAAYMDSLQPGVQKPKPDVSITE